MNAREGKTLLLALGNDILGDDGAGLAAARRLEGACAPSVDVVLSSEAGLALIDLMEGYERALLLDSVVTGAPPGTVHDFSPSDFRRVMAPSPHYAGLPEVLQLAERLEIPFPREIRVLALEVEDPYRITECLSPAVERSIPAFVEAARRILENWRCTSTA